MIEIAMGVITGCLVMLLWSQSDQETRQDRIIELLEQINTEIKKDKTEE